MKVINSLNIDVRNRLADLAGKMIVSHQLFGKMRHLHVYRALGVTPSIMPIVNWIQEYATGVND